MRTLLIDNHDSYTYNLFHLVASVNGEDPLVLSNDDPELARLSFGDVDNVADMWRDGAHRYSKDAAEASATAIKAGNDLCSGKTYEALGEALKRGLVTEKGKEWVGDLDLHSIEINGRLAEADEVLEFMTIANRRFAEMWKKTGRKMNSVTAI